MSDSNFSSNLAPQETKTVEFWAEAKGTPSWLLAATRVNAGWAVGTELSESAYDSAIGRTETLRLQ